MRLLLLAAMVMVGGCRFNTSGLSPAGELDGTAERRTAADAPADLPEDRAQPTEAASPTDARAEVRPDARGPDARPPDAPRPDGKLADTRPPDTRPPDKRPPDTRAPDTRPPDTRPPDTAPPCVTDHFLAASGWNVTVLKGPWSWKAPTHARHQLPALGYSVGEALIQGSAAMLGKKLVGTTTFTLRAVYQNGNGHGAGLALLIQDSKSATVADKLVACVARQSSSLGTSANASIWSFGGSTNAAATVDSGASLNASILDKPALLTMTLVPSGGTGLTMTCTVEVDAVQSSATAEISSYATAPPFGIGLVSFGATVDVDAFSLCP